MPKAALDDHFAAGTLSVADLRRMRQRFTPVDVGAERLSHDEELRRAVEAMRAVIESLPARTQVECNARAIARYLVGVASEHGNPGERGVGRVHPSMRQISTATRIGSLQTVGKALDHLEGVGFLERAAGPRGGHRAATYLLLYPWGGGMAQSVHYREMGAAGNEGQEQKEQKQRTRFPLYKRPYPVSVHSTHLKSQAPDVPALRNSKLRHEWVRKEGRRVVVDSQYFKRYGKKREEMFRHTLRFSGADEVELWEKFGSRTSTLARFLKTWVEPMLSDGVLVRDGARIYPAADWPETLERVRERTDEDGDNRRQDEKYADQRRKYREHIAAVRRGEIPAKADKEGDLLGKERMAPIVEARQADDARARIEEQRAKVGITAEVFLTDEMEGVLALRWQELRVRWTQRGGRGEDLRLAVRDGAYRFEREEADEGHLYVYHEAREPRPDREQPAAVVPINNGAPVAMPETEDARPRKPYKRADGVYVHPPDCACEWCEEPPARNYVRIGSTA
jgi:hypothetical protein